MCMDPALGGDFEPVEVSVDEEPEAAAEIFAEALHDNSDGGYYPKSIVVMDPVSKESVTCLIEVEISFNAYRKNAAADAPQS